MAWLSAFDPDQAQKPRLALASKSIAAISVSAFSLSVVRSSNTDPKAIAPVKALQKAIPFCASVRSISFEWRRRSDPHHFKIDPLIVDAHHVFGAPQQLT